jgi:hypothetical protein
VSESPDKKKPGPKPEVLRVPLAFEDAIDAALKTKPPPREPKKKPKTRP